MCVCYITPLNLESREERGKKNKGNNSPKSKCWQCWQCLVTWVIRSLFLAHRQRSSNVATGNQPSQWRAGSELYLMRCAKSG
jgi:hypothetical protein